MTPPTRAPSPTGPWTPGDAAELYQIGDWSQGYFDVSSDGHVAVRPNAEPEPDIDLLEVVEGLRDRGVDPPFLIRFSDITAHRLRSLRRAFDAAMADNDYGGDYVAVYPIKVNQQRSVVEEIYRYGAEHDFGMEVGSKAELLAVMALTRGSPERLIVCNGFKDDDYIEAAILAAKLGRRIVPVVENLGEAELILKHAERHDVSPRLGVRVKLASQGAGRWRESSGERSKFGLFAGEVLELLEMLGEAGHEDALRLVHCHPGSQIQDIGRLKHAIAELGQFYAELRRLGAPVEFLDVGGGLGVDYDGSRRDRESSMNYTVEEYASEVVYRVARVCEERDVPEPTIVSESGRAIASYQSVLVFDVLGETGVHMPAAEDGELEPPDEEAPGPLQDLWAARESVGPDDLVEPFHDVVEARRQAMHLFRLGYLGLEQRAWAKRVYASTCARIRDVAAGLPEVPEELGPLTGILAETYFCNFSIFQSLPDAWAIDQLFPVMPIHRLDERPGRRVVLGDMTCDSDGKLDRFTDVRGARTTLPVHDLRKGEPYYLAAFLVGAYQEILGDLHNLYGDTHAAHVRLDEEGGWWVEELVRGDSCSDVLGYVHYDPERLYPRLEKDCERAVREGQLTVAERRALLEFYESALGGYTYLEPGAS